MQRPGAADHQVRLRPLCRSQFDLLRRWLAEPVVARWWHHETSSEALERDFGPAVDGRDATTVQIADLGGRAFGLIQHFAIEAYPDYAAELSGVCRVPSAARSIDYLIGEPSYRGRGLGAEMITVCLEEIWTKYGRADDVIVPVQAENRASWRSLERAGLGRIATGHMKPDNPADSTEHLIYHATRPRP
jgi:aminoglycoside 6'-N-acetyltransferase